MVRAIIAPMALEAAPDALARGEEALRTGDWEGARTAFLDVLADVEDPRAEEGLGRALWWLHDLDGAVERIERAYVGLRAAGDDRRAARAAVWLAREHAAGFGNFAASAGWYARAERLLQDAGDVPERGWLAIARAERASAPTDLRRNAAWALELARRLHDADLEAAALVRVGYAEVASGEVEAGMGKVDEAMAAATGGEVRSLETVGDVICVGVGACELAADWQRIEQWGRVLERWVERHGHVAVLGFCAACCAEMLVASGEWETAEGMLAEGLARMRDAGMRARCVHPAAKLAELRLRQGRLEEAEHLLAGYEHLPESVHALASLHLAKGETAMAAAVLHRRLNAIGGDNVLAAPLLALLVDVRLSQGNGVGAAATAERLAAIGERAGLPRVMAMGALARGRAGLATGDPGAPGHLETALRVFADLGMALDAARTRLDLARAHEANEPEVAVGEARTALAELERLGAPRDADAAAALLRRQGVAGRTGPKGLGLLSRRELEVLRLLAEGLTNAEIAARLFISTKTAGHHVGSVLAKLNLRSRSEAAAYAVRYLAPDPGAR